MNNSKSQEQGAYVFVKKETITVNLREQEIFPCNKYTLRIYAHERNPPHFHVISKDEGYEVELLIETGEFYKFIWRGTREMTDEFEDVVKKAKEWLEREPAHPYMKVFGTNRRYLEIIWESQTNMRPDCPEQYPYRDVCAANLYDQNLFPRYEYGVTVYSGCSNPPHFFIYSEREGYEIKLLIKNGELHEVVNYGSRDKSDNLADVVEKAKRWLRQKPAFKLARPLGTNKKVLEMMWKGANTEDEFTFDGNDSDSLQEELNYENSASV